MSPKLTFEDNTSGSLTFTMPATNAGYSHLHRMTSKVVVKKDGVEIFEGRVIEETTDFWKNRSITCEGELGYLNDTTQPMAEFHNISPENFLKTLINNHNAKVEDDKKFTVGYVTVTDHSGNDEIYRYTNRESTLSDILDKLVERLGGHLVIRKENGVRYLDYLKDYPNSTSQTIEFGKNLLDYSVEYELTDLATVLLPLGEMLEDSPIDALTDYLTVEEVNQGSPYVVNQNAKDIYGWIEKVVHWDDVTEPANLLSKAQQYLTDYQFDQMILNVTVMDLHELNPDIQEIKFLDQVRCISTPHGMNKVFPVTKMTIPIDKPEDTAYILGEKQTTSFTAQVRQANDEATSQMDTNMHNAIDEATSRATALIAGATNGYITITTNDDQTQELYISDTPNYLNATKLWRWNINGLGYSDDGGETYGLAMTMDGTIVADYIRAGVIRDRSGDDNVVIDLDNGTASIKGDIYATTLTFDDELKMHSTGLDEKYTVIKTRDYYPPGSTTPYGALADIYMNSSDAANLTPTIQFMPTNAYGCPIMLNHSTEVVGHMVVTDGMSIGGRVDIGNSGVDNFDLHVTRYVYAKYFNTTCADQNPASYTSSVAFIDSNGYLRKSSKANFVSWLGTVTKATYANLNYLGYTSSSTAKNFTINANATEIIITGSFTGDNINKLFTSSIPKNLLSTTAKEVWLGGGGGGTTGSQARCLCNVTLVNSTTVQVKGTAASNGTTNMLSSTTFCVYQR